MYYVLWVGECDFEILEKEGRNLARSTNSHSEDYLRVIIIFFFLSNSTTSLPHFSYSFRFSARGTSFMRYRTRVIYCSARIAPRSTLCVRYIQRTQSTNSIFYTFVIHFFFYNINDFQINTRVHSVGPGTRAADTGERGRENASV